MDVGQLVLKISFLSLLFLERLKRHCPFQYESFEYHICMITLDFLPSHVCIHLSMIMLLMSVSIFTSAVGFKRGDRSLAHSLSSRQNNSITRLTASVESARPVFLWPAAAALWRSLAKATPSLRFACWNDITLLCTQRRNESGMKRPGLPARLLSWSDKARCDNTASDRNVNTEGCCCFARAAAAVWHVWGARNQDGDWCHRGMSNLREVRRGCQVNLNWIKGCKV